MDDILCMFGSVKKFAVWVGHWRKTTTGSCVMLGKIHVTVNQNKSYLSKLSSSSKICFSNLPFSLFKAWRKE